MTDCKINEYVDDEGSKTLVDTGYGEYALGLNPEPKGALAALPLSEFVGELSEADAREIVGSEDFKFGRSRFDSSWIRDQNGWGKCASSAGTGALERAFEMTGRGRVHLSDDYLYSLVNGGRDRGSLLSENMAAILNNGICTSQTVTRGEIYRNKYNTQQADQEAKRFRGHELYVLPNEAAIVTALACRFPVVMAINVDRNWRRFDNDDFLAENNGMGNHSELLDDIKWDAKRGCFAFRKATSHGVDYSGDGYCWTTFEANYKTSIKYHDFYCIPSVCDDPKGDNPPIPDDGETNPEPVEKAVLTVQSSATCSACVRWKNEVRQSVEQAGIIVQDGTVPPEKVNGQNLIPRFTLRVGDKEQSRVGYWGLAEIQAAIRRMQ